MAPPKRPWFRFYVEVFNDLELRQLPPAQRWVWAAILGLARSSPVAGALLDKAGKPLTLTHVADFAAVTLREVKAAVLRFEALRMVWRDDCGTLIVTRWDARQFESDDVAARTAKHRAKNVEGNDHATPNGTFHDTPDGTFPPSVDLPEIQRTDSSSSTSEEPLREADRDDDDVVNEAMRVLARRDLARVEAEKGARHDATAWLTTATQRRWNQHVVAAERIAANKPGLNADELADIIEPPNAEPARPSPLDEQQEARRRIAEEEQAAHHRMLEEAKAQQKSDEERRAFVEAQRLARQQVKS